MPAYPKIKTKKPEKSTASHFKPFAKVKTTKFFNNSKNKYGNNTSVYNGRTYDSIKEANYAKELDWRKKAGEIKEIIPQFKLPLSAHGVHICNYFVDFKVILKDGSTEYHEVKGLIIQPFPIKFKMAKAQYGEEKFVLIK